MVNNVYTVVEKSQFNGDVLRKLTFNTLVEVAGFVGCSRPTVSRYLQRGHFAGKWFKLNEFISITKN